MLATLFCLVVGVSDGDTLTARCGEQGQFQQVKIRLSEIDAPEKGQPFGQRSRASLAAVCFGAVAQIHPERRDRYGRSVARVQCRGTDASLYQVRMGMAWAYTQYLTDSRIADTEIQARTGRVGLWSEEAPIAPWDYRAGQRARGAAYR